MTDDEIKAWRAEADGLLAQAIASGECPEGVADGMAWRSRGGHRGGTELLELASAVDALLAKEADRG